VKRLYLLFIFCQLTISSCSSDITGPPEENIPAGRRDYEWTVDTLKSPELLDISRLWGSSPDNVWAIGTSSSTATTIWHYDGNIWRCDSAYRPMTPWAIFGFSPNEVWIGTNNSYVWKYDGKSWMPFKEYKKNGYTNIVFLNMYGVSPNQIYAVGYAERYNPYSYTGIVMCYDGTDWKFIDIPDVETSFMGIRVDKKTGTLIIQGYTEGVGGKLYAWDGKNLTEIYNGDYPAVSNINDQIVVTIKQKIYKYTNSKLVLWMDETGSNLIGKIWGGRSEKDFFWNSYNGVAHFNGTNFEILYEITADNNTGINAGIIFEKEVFFLTKQIDYQEKNIIIHGRLKEGEN
jgi:hypothetical protein